ncbi:sugar transporter [Winogradskyella sp. KYW1333]|uniref:sugar transporter n=1 Tax=Winogradskyella sp. KYW1333 TaxID=2282123 RepID=UPI000DF11D4C|nr:sugar transporter [Winogradskyella sp. KYW1333]RCT54255.1 sugar transporter [Winogradskyella sp. KYW1333]
MARVSKSLKNAKVGVFFFILSIFVQFFSRKIFLENLGDEFIGLETTLRSILSFLNLAELGIGTAIGFTLYKPIFDENHDEINKIIALLGVLYRRIGYIIFGVGFIISLFFPLIFADTPFSLTIIYYVFYSLLISVLLSYFVNYHISLLGADQKGYIVQQYFQTFTITRVILQFIVALYYKNFFVYITLELVFSIIYSVVVRYKIKQEYPWLVINSAQKTEIIKEYPQVITKIKQVFFHKLSAFVKNGTDNLLIYALINLQSVAFFGNYQLIFMKLIGLVKMAFAGTGSAVGNLIAENDEKNINKVLWELISIQFFIAGFFSLVIYHTMDAFVLLWLGEKYILSHTILLLMIANFFMIQISSPIERFKNAYGLYSDTWAAMTEAVINLVISFIFGKLLGIAGIVLGTVVSMFFIVVLWKPYFLYKRGFKKSVLHYWKGLLPMIIVFIATIFFIYIIKDYFYYNSDNITLINWIIYAIQVTIVVTIVYGTMLYLFVPGFKDFCIRVKTLVLSKIQK